MRALKELYLNECQMSDRGTKAVLEKLDEGKIALEILDLSGNLIGQSPYARESAAQFCQYFPSQV